MSEFDSEIRVRRVRYASDDTGWAVIDGATSDGSPVVVVGTLSHLEEGDRAHVQGTWVQDGRYGRQVRARQALPLAPEDEAAVLAYLQRLPRIGGRRAQRLLDCLEGDDPIAAIDRDPRHALSLAGLSPASAAEAATAWERLRVTRRLHLLLAPHGLAHLVARVHDAYGHDAHRVLVERPYALTRLFGVSFAIADRIAHAGPAPPNPRERARAGVTHLLGEAERAGSTCLAEQALLRSLTDLLEGESPDGIIDELVNDGELVRDGEWIYRRETAELESELAERIAELVAEPPAGRLRDPGHAPTPPAAPNPGSHGVQALTTEQAAAVRAAFCHRLSLVTGGPGTGKTATIRTIAARAVEQGARVMLVAPTGRAAVRMSEATGLAAGTVHAALHWVPGEGPSHDGEDPLRCELLIVDETSMANLELLVVLLRAVPPRASVVLVGDADQLAPVGAGKPFAELVEGGLVVTTRLTHIFRQAAGSMIVQGAHAVREGREPEVRPSAGMRRDLFLIEHADPLGAREEIVGLVSERLPRHFEIDPVRDIQVFAPVYRGELGIDALNVALRQALNADGPPVRGGRLRIGDKVMMTGRNLHELGLMNGMVMSVLDAVGGDDEHALILRSDEAVFRVASDQWDLLRLAYACSIHRGQGIELPVAIIVAHAAAGAFFLRREMLYTALTRARLATVIVGTRDVVRRAARTPDTGRRSSRLSVRLVRAAHARHGVHGRSATAAIARRAPPEVLEARFRAATQPVVAAETRPRGATA